MAWESRNGVGRYYTRSLRINGKVTRLYCGSGAFGELAASTDALTRLIRQQERDQLSQLDTLARQLDEYCQAIDTEVQVQLRRAGWHQHKREWRRARHARAR